MSSRTDAPKPSTSPITDPDMPEEIDLSRGVRGQHFPTEEPERSRRLLERVRTLQRTAVELRDENMSLRTALREARTHLDFAKPGSAHVDSKIDRLLGIATEGSD